MDKCMFENPNFKNGCEALTFKQCAGCNFYKSEKRYKRNMDGYIEKRSEYNGNTSIDNR